MWNSEYANLQLTAKTTQKSAIIWQNYPELSGFIVNVNASYPQKPCCIATLTVTPQVAIIVSRR
jgi:hypothetical protein